jgi:hypothetical protein
MPERDAVPFAEAIAALKSVPTDDNLWPYPEFGREIVPTHVAVMVPAHLSNSALNVPPPVALANEPVPPVTVYVPVAVAKHESFGPAN